MQQNKIEIIDLKNQTQKTKITLILYTVKIH